MSIKSLFEDIADAIREKSGINDTYTPAEMPSAIRSIPSGSSTASGVTYDNTASGLTANNVQDAIDEMAGDVSTIYSDLSEINSNFYWQTNTIGIHETLVYVNVAGVGKFSTLIPSNEFVLGSTRTIIWGCGDPSNVEIRVNYIAGAVTLDRVYVNGSQVTGSTMTYYGR